MSSMTPHLALPSWWHDLTAYLSGLPNADLFWSAVLVLGTALVVVAAKSVRNWSVKRRRRLAAAALVVLVVVTLIVDVPGFEGYRDYMSKRALLSGVLTSVLLLGAGFLALDAEADQRKEDRAKRLHRTALGQVRHGWVQAHRNARFEMNFASPVDQPEAFYDALRDSEYEAAIWASLLVTLGDEDSLRAVELLTKYRGEIKPLLHARPLNPRPIKAWSHHLGRAGVTLEELHYLVTDPWKSKACFVPDWAEEPWHQATGTMPPGYSGPSLYSTQDPETSRVIAEHRYRVLATHGTFSEGADVWRVVSAHAQRLHQTTLPTNPAAFDPQEPPEPHESHLDWLASTTYASADLLAMREARAKAMADRGHRDSRARARNRRRR